ncbi:MAG: hypothetical protein AAFR51_13700 [Pseudomonadota bacterium]
MISRNSAALIQDNPPVCIDASALPSTDDAEGLIAVGAGRLRLRVMIHRADISDLRPLVILNSVDFPMPPSEAFCEKMWAAGFQVIFIERPGFGTSPALPKAVLQDAQIDNGAAVATEASLIYMLLSQMELKDIVLLGMGSANPVCYRLARMHSEIELSIFSNAMFNQDIWGVFRPKWFQAMLRQTVGSKPGLHFATYGVKYQLRRAPMTFYRQLLQKSPGDIRYFEANKTAFLEASRLIRRIEASTFNYDLKMSLSRDDSLKTGFFEGVNGVVFSGQETTDLWKSQMEAEAGRLNLPTVYAPHGDLFAPYASPEFLIRTIGERTKVRKKAPLPFG